MTTIFPTLGSGLKSQNNSSIGLKQTSFHRLLSKVVCPTLGTGLKVIIHSLHKTDLVIQQQDQILVRKLLYKS